MGKKIELERTWYWSQRSIFIYILFINQSSDELWTWRTRIEHISWRIHWEIRNRNEISSKGLGIDKENRRCMLCSLWAIHWRMNESDLFCFSSNVKRYWLKLKNWSPIYIAKWRRRSHLYVALIESEVNASFFSL